MLTEFNDITYYINKWNIKIFWLSPCFSSTHLCGTRAAAAATDDLSNTTLVIHCCKISSSCLIVICLTLQKLPFLWLTWFFEKSFFHEGVILKSNQIKSNCLFPEKKMIVISKQIDLVTWDWSQISIDKILSACL